MRCSSAHHGWKASMTVWRSSAPWFRPALDESKIIAVRHENVMATSFHPEVTDDLRIHRYFVDLVRAARQKPGSRQASFDYASRVWLQTGPNPPDWQDCPSYWRSRRVRLRCRWTGPLDPSVAAPAVGLGSGAVGLLTALGRLGGFGFGRALSWGALGWRSRCRRDAPRAPQAQVHDSVASSSWAAGTTGASGSDGPMAVTPAQQPPAAEQPAPGRAGAVPRAHPQCPRRSPRRKQDRLLATEAERARNLTTSVGRVRRLSCLWRCGREAAGLGLRTATGG